MNNGRGLLLFQEGWSPRFSTPTYIFPSVPRMRILTARFPDVLSRVTLPAPHGTSLGAPRFQSKRLDPWRVARSSRQGVSEA
jgi:hypothetical protein